MRLFCVGFAFQARLAWRAPDTMQILVTAPLFTLVFLTIIEHAGRMDLAAVAVVAPTLMSLWTVGLMTAGQLITEERAQGVLEGLVASPASLPVLVLARMCAVTLLGTLSFAEAWLVSGLLFGHWLTVGHPVLFALALLATALATAATASIMASVFVLLPSARLVQNTLSYPFYLLSGVLVPLAFLPDWLRPVSRLVFLSWSADLLRDGLSDRPVAHALGRILVILVLGAGGFGVGVLLLNRFLRRVRQLGTLSQT